LFLTSPPATLASCGQGFTPAASLAPDQCSPPANAHPLTATVSKDAGKTWQIVGNLAAGPHEFILPLWLFLPAGIPSFLWWRKWKKARGGRGFPVQSPSAAPPPAPEAVKNI